MNLTLNFIFSLSILIAGTLAIFRYSKIKESYRPFIYLIWIGCINEIISYLLIINGNYNIVNSNLYGLVESLLLVWFFRNLGVFRSRNLIFEFILVIFVIIWIIESFFVHRFGTAISSIFFIFYSFIIVLLSITAINMMIFRERELLKHPAFLICIAIVIFFTYRVMVELFWLVGYQSSPEFSNRVYFILVAINLLCNLIYALAILWMQKKQAFSIQS